MSSHSHKQAAPAQVRVHVATVSDTRTVADDKSGALVCGLLRDAGHTVVQHVIVPDELSQLRALITSVCAGEEADALLLTGGTGITHRDVTFEAVRAVLDKELPGFGELFRMLSFQEIGAAAMLSRAIAGVRQGVIVVAMPGSSGAVKLAMERLLLPELGHLVWEARRHGRTSQPIG